MKDKNTSYKYVQVGFPPKEGTPAHKELIKKRSQAGSSNAGTHKGKKYYAGPAGGAAPFTFPIDTTKDAEDALRLRGKAPNPAGIMRAVFELHPELKEKRKESGQSVGESRGKTILKRR